MRTGHPPIQRLADMAAGLLGALERSRLEQHVAQCARCSADLERLTATISCMRYGEEPSPTSTGGLEQLIGVLRFDSATMPPAYGLRGAADSETRRLLFEAGPYQLEVQTTPAKAGWTIQGQLLGPTDATSGEARLLNPKVNARCGLTELLEFNLPVVPTGTYRLELQLGDATQVYVDSLELGS
jgi:hypothetical protein